jgi:hypothetical protein
MISARLLLLTTLLVTATASAATFEADKQATLKRQAELDQACEAARSAKLAPMRQQLFNECMNSKKTANTEQDCKRQSADYNGNRQGAGPLFYDLPACVTAFEYKKANPVNQ